MSKTKEGSFKCFKSRKLHEHDSWGCCMNGIATLSVYEKIDIRLSVEAMKLLRWLKLVKLLIMECALSLAYMYISLTSGRPDPWRFKTPIQIATLLASHFSASRSRKFLAAEDLLSKVSRMSFWIIQYASELMHTRQLPEDPGKCIIIMTAWLR
jgi:hypothetical protein